MKITPIFAGTFISAVLLSATPQVLAASVTFNVVDYGATANDGSDDTAGIQAALDAAEALAGVDTVYLPAGDYHVATMLRIGGDTLLCGDGSDGGTVSQLLMSDGFQEGTDLLRNRNTGAGDQNITIEKIRFNGRGDSQSGTFIHLVDMINVVGLRVDDCEFHDAQAIGMVVQGNLSVESNTEVVNCYATGNEVGFYAQAQYDTVDGLHDVCFSNCLSVGNDWGFDVYMIQHATYFDCVTSNNLSGVGRGFTTDSCNDLYYTNCLSQNNGEHGFAVYINLNNKHHPNDVVFEDCDSLDNTKCGFQIGNARDITLRNVRALGNEIGIEGVSSFWNERQLTGLRVENSQVISNRYHGIYLLGVRDSEIRECVINNNSQAVGLSGVFDGIMIRDGLDYGDDTKLPSSNILIRDNVVGNTGSGATQNYGVLSVERSDFVTLLDNDLTLNLTAPYLLVGANNAIITSPSYAAWTYDWGVDIGSDTNDYDGDLLSNFGEYALGGDPTNGVDAGEVPTFGSHGGAMVYVHAQRSDDSTLSYALETTGDLFSSVWTNCDDLAMTTNVAGGTFNFVTNTIPTAGDSAFFRLRIERR